MTLIDNSWRIKVIFLHVSKLCQSSPHMAIQGSVCAGCYQISGVGALKYEYVLMETSKETLRVKSRNFIPIEMSRYCTFFKFVHWLRI